jgi:hypothetical protein
VGLYGAARAAGLVVCFCYKRSLSEGARLRVSLMFVRFVLLAIAGTAALLTAGVVDAHAAPKPRRATGLHGCIETRGSRETRRDLKLRVGPCRNGEIPITWPPGSAGPTGPTGPSGPDRRCWRGRPDRPARPPRWHRRRGCDWRDG